MHAALRMATFAILALGLLTGADAGDAPPPSLAEAPPASAKDFREEDVRATLTDVIAARSQDGVFLFHDAKTDTDLKQPAA